MPTLFRFLLVIAVLAGLAYGAMIALVIFVKPNVAEISVRVPLDRLSHQPAAPRTADEKTSGAGAVRP